MWELSAIPSPYINESESGHAAPDEAVLNYLTESIFARSRSGSGEANMTISPRNVRFTPNNGDCSARETGPFYARSGHN